jgi:hypothetical protein
MRLAALSVAAGLSLPFLAGCAHEARPGGAQPVRAVTEPIAPPAAAPHPPSGDPAEVTQGRGTIADLEALCARLHPECRHPFLQSVGPQHPCAGRGARCRDEDLAGWAPRFACACEECAADGDCGPGARCSADAVGCPPERVPRRCARGEVPREPVCLDPPSAARP